MDRLRQDLVHSVRRLAKMPGFVLAVVVSIGLGIGANATIFSMVSRFVLEPPPVRDPGRLMALHMTQKGEDCCNNFPYPQYQDVQGAAKSFSGVAGYEDMVPASLESGGEPERVWGQTATVNYFDVAQAPMAVGRGFAPDEAKQQVVVLGYRLWQRRFGGDAAIVGRTVHLSGKPFVVVGVAGEGFRGLQPILNSQFWVPLGAAGALGTGEPSWTSRENHWVSVIARLAPGVTRAQAAGELHTIAANLAKAYPATDKGNGFAMDEAGSLPPRGRTMVLVFLAALSVVALLVLGIACANVSNLLLAQAASRQREMAVRLALGAKTSQLVRPMLVESTLLALAGGVAGTLLALWTTSALSAFHLPSPVPLNLAIGVDGRVLLATFVTSVGAGVLFGLAPAWIASRPMLARALRGEDALARPGRRITLRNASGGGADCHVHGAAVRDGAVSAQPGKRDGDRCGIQDARTADGFGGSAAAWIPQPGRRMRFLREAAGADCGRCRAWSSVAATDMVPLTVGIAAMASWWRAESRAGRRRSWMSIWRAPVTSTRLAFRGSRGATSGTRRRTGRRWRW